MMPNKYVEKISYVIKRQGMEEEASDVKEKQLTDRANTISHKFFYYIRGLFG